MKTEKLLIIAFASIAVTGVLLIQLVPSAFADNPTPHGEWNLDMSFSDDMVKQLPSDLHRMEITVQANALGTMPESTVNIYADITKPDGIQYTVFGTIHDIPRGESGIIRLPTTITQEGKYVIDVRMTSVGKNADHLFDTVSVEYVVPKHGFMKVVSTVCVEADDMMGCHVEDPRSVKHYEALAAVFNIDNTMGEFDKIVVTHGDYQRDYPIDADVIYMRANNGYAYTELFLQKADQLIPLADAQNSVHEYLQFYKFDKYECSKLGCISLNAEQIPEPFEFSLEVLLVVDIVAAATSAFIIKSKSKKSFDMTSTNNSKKNMKKTNSHHDRDDEIKPYLNPIR